MRLIDQFSAPSIEVLLNSTWVITLLLGIIWTLLRIMRRPSAAYKSMVWNLSMKAVLFVPILFACLPVIRSLKPVYVNKTEQIVEPVPANTKAPTLRATPMPIQQEQSQQVPVELPHGVKLGKYLWLISR